MAKNIRLEILSLLAEKQGKAADIRQFLNEIIQADRHTAPYLDIMLQAMRTNRLISYEGLVHNSGNVNAPFMVSIEPQGLVELNRKKKMTGV